MKKEMHLINIAIIVSEFHGEITEKLQEGACHYLQNAGMSLQQLYIVNVPGAVEIPLTAKWLAETGRYDAIICLGAVVRGETGHYDYVCEQVSQGCQQVMLSFGLPVIFGVLTTETMAQAYARVGGDRGHKGFDAAAAALRMIQVKEALVCYHGSHSEKSLGS